MTSDSNIIPLSRFRALLARPRGARRIEELLSAADPAAAVAELSVPDVYSLVKEVGLEDSLDLIGLATPEQLRGCVDLDAWERDRLELDAVLPWLGAVADAAGFEKLGQVWEGLDPELAALLLAHSCRIYDLSLGEEVDESTERPVYLTPDRFFAIELMSERDEQGQMIMRLIEDLYRADMVVAQHTVMSARSEMLSDLEEQSYRWRTGRMADLGYPDFYDALEVFRPLDPARVEIGEGTAEAALPADPDDPDDRARAPGHLPAPLVEQAVGRAFLARALDQIGDAAVAERLEQALLGLVNRVLAAARVTPGDAEGIAIGAGHATATLALGLETVAHGQLDRAVAALETISLTRLHRVGYTVALRVSRYARAIAARAATAGEPSVSVLEALSGPRPFYPTALDDAAAVKADAGVRPFETLDDIRRVAEHLTRLALRIAIAGSLGVDLLAIGELPDPRPELDDHVRTALVRSCGSGELEAAPLTAAEIAAFRDRAFRDGDIPGAVREGALAALIARLDAAGIVAGREFLPGLVTGWLDELEQTFGAIEGDVDPRFVDGVISAADKD